MIFRRLTSILFTILFFLCITIVANAKLINISFGEKFSLEKGDIAYLRDINAELYLKGFTYSPCPEGMQCVWSGLAVHYEFRVNGKIYTDAEPLSIPYEIEVGKSDFKSFSEFTVWNSIERCMQMKDGILPNGLKAYNKDACWSQLAWRLSNVEYCRRIQNAKGKDACIEYLLDKIDKPELCGEVETPLMFCKYRQAVLESNPDMCSDVIRWGYKIRCYKEVSEITGEGVAMCDQMRVREKSDIEFCRDSITGKRTY